MDSKKKQVQLAVQPTLNNDYNSDVVKSQIASAFINRGTFNHIESSAYVINDPFPCCVLPGFINNDSFLNGLKEELMDQIFHEKNNDLYKFQQSDDLKKISLPHVKAFKKTMKTDLLPWMRDVSGIDLSETIDMTCSRYDFTDTLLCHDDELEGRRIAFILYLVPPWREDDGGALDLFSVSNNGEPNRVVKSIVPEWNMFTFFEVSPVSFHQVSEVLARDKIRLSINGWFHGPNIARPMPYIEPPRLLSGHDDGACCELEEFLNPIYLKFEVQAQIQDKFENESEIELQGFFRDEKYQEISLALNNNDIVWEPLGPPNKRSYNRARPDNVPHILRQLYKIFHSEEMFLMLSNMTGLCLHELVPHESDESDEASGNVYASRLSMEDVVCEGTIGEGDSDTDNDAKSEKPCKKRRKRNSETETLGSTSVVKVAREKPNPKCHVEFRKWTHNCYTLLNDSNHDIGECSLDVNLTFNCDGWKDSFGGFTSYLAKDEDEELLTVNRIPNSLALIYRDKDTLKFVKHINNEVKDLNDCGVFHDISATFYE